MKTAPALCFLVAFVAAAAAEYDPHDDKTFLSRQRDVLRLFVKIQEPPVFPEHIDIIKSFSWNKIKSRLNVEDRPTLERFIQMLNEKVLLQRKEDFSIMYPEHLWQAKELFDVLYLISDFETFYKVAVKLRYVVNEGMYEYVLRLVLRHRWRTSNLQQPPPYEVLPQFFVTSDVLQRAYEGCIRGLCADEENPFILRANYTGSQTSRNPEARLSYFREDVGLSSFMAFLHREHLPLWGNGTEEMCGSQAVGSLVYYFILRNLLARYDLERLSHHLQPVTPVDVWEPVTEGYDPHLRLLSGRSVAARPGGLRPSRTDVVSVDEVIFWERRVCDVAASGLVLEEKELQDFPEKATVLILAFLLTSSSQCFLKHNPNVSVLWGLLALYGRIPDPQHKYGMAPSALEMHLTMHRDPLYYRILKRIYGIFEVHLSNLPLYHAQDLTVEGVEINELKVDKLVTFFEDFDIRLDNAIDVGKIQDIRKTNVVARQERLNHEPFSYSLKVASETEQETKVWVFLGPAGAWEDPADFRRQFYVIDLFKIQLKRGANSFVRRSSEMVEVEADPSSFWELYDRVEARLAGAGRGNLSAEEELRRQAPGPLNRLLLPRGRADGLPLTVLAFVTDDVEKFIRGISYRELKAVPNAHLEPVTVFHLPSKDAKS